MCHQSQSISTFRTLPKYLSHPMRLFDAFLPHVLYIIAALFCILYTLVDPWKLRHGEVLEKP